MPFRGEGREGSNSPNKHGTSRIGLLKLLLSVDRKSPGRESGLDEVDGGVREVAEEDPELDSTEISHVGRCIWVLSVFGFEVLG